ncbi:MFS transporter [Gordonia sp. HNM0687]|uniref:MFS transporter n=2 Tax=Gordonia mangrovi TaxID=2665643 RepID=A0A6L7GTT9_9ACTN|nr:MFS transporter [Gordonia mangrovi]
MVTRYTDDTHVGAQTTPDSHTKRALRWAGPALAFAGLGGSFTQTILIPIQGELPELLGASATSTAWAVTITLLVAAVFTPISGRFGDMFGKRRVSLILIAVLIIGSAVCALSNSVIPLIVGRGLQGVGVGVVAVGIAMVRDILPASRVGSTAAMVSATIGVGAALGLPISAFVAQHFDWHMLFWLSAAISIGTFALVAWALPTESPKTGGKVDWVGIVGMSAGLSGLLLCLSHGREWEWTSVRTMAVLGGSAAVLVLWVWHELRVRQPLVDVRVNTRRAVLLTNLASAAMGMAWFASQVAFPQLLQLPTAVGGVSLSLVEASLVLMPSGLAMLAMAPVAGRLERRSGPKPLLVAAAVLIAIAFCLALTMTMGQWTVLFINVLIGVGIGMGYAAMPTLILQSVPRSETGSANGVNTLMRAVGAAVGAAVVGAVLAIEPAPGAADNRQHVSAAFDETFLFGLVAALLCGLFAAFIPARGPAAVSGTEVPGPSSRGRRFPRSRLIRHRGTAYPTNSPSRTSL